MIKEQQSAATVAVENVQLLWGPVYSWHIYLHICGVKLAGCLEYIMYFAKQRVEWAKSCVGCSLSPSWVCTCLHTALYVPFQQLLLPSNAFVLFVILCKYPECVFLHASVKADETGDNTLNEMLCHVFKLYYIINCGHRLTRSCLSRLESIHEISMLEKKVNLTFFLTEGWHSVGWKGFCPLPDVFACLSRLNVSHHQTSLNIKLPHL